MFESRRADDGKARIDRRYFLPTGLHGMVEQAPARCPVGHPLGADTVLVASHPCGCTTVAHRLWRCWACDRVWVRPPCDHHPEWVYWAVQPKR